MAVIDQIILRIQIERPVAGIKLLLTIIQHEVTITINSGIGPYAGGFQTTLACIEIDTCYIYTQSDLLGVCSAPIILRGLSALYRLAHHLGKVDIAALKPNGVRIGYIITYNIHSLLMCSQT